MAYSSVQDMIKDLGDVELKETKIIINDPDRFKSETIDNLVYNAVFNENNNIRNGARWIIRKAAENLDIYLSSIQEVYEAKGEGKFAHATVPAMNIRGLTYDVARAAIRAALQNNVGAFIFEIAKSEIGYTEQRPAEYAASVTAAAVKEGYKGPLFLQGDHYQIKNVSYRENSEAEIQSIKDLIDESLAAGFYNIDIDSSTLVDLSRPTVKEQQEDNYKVTADLTYYIRVQEPPRLTVSIGGEIGEVGGKNSTEEELRAYLDGYKEILYEIGGGFIGLSKISIQTGTTHGGVPLPDGTIAKVKLDFDTLEKLSSLARTEYNMSGAVQHGASTLPDEAFDKFPQTNTAEVHLATGFQNIILDHPAFPADLRNEINDYIKTKHASEKSEGQTEEQFIYKTRKKSFGPFKKKMWDLPEDTRMAICGDLEKKFAFLFEKLNVNNSYDFVADSITKVIPKIEMPQALMGQ